MLHGLDAVETDARSQPSPAGGGGLRGQGVAGTVERVVDRLNQLIVMVSSVALVAAACVLTYSVASRYFLHLSTDWQDELSVFLIVGAVFMSSAAIQAQRGHVGIEAIVSLLPPHANAVRQWLVDVASFVFCGYFAWKSWTLLDEAWVEDYHSESTWGPPLWIPYSLMAVGMTLLAMQLLLQVAKPLYGAAPTRRA
jgi:TRAP-type C4-dicarboxylate transport system permease small subunit